MTAKLYSNTCNRKWRLTQSEFSFSTVGICLQFERRLTESCSYRDWIHALSTIKLILSYTTLLQGYAHRYIHFMNFIFCTLSKRRCCTWKKILYSHFSCVPGFLHTSRIPFSHMSHEKGLDPRFVAYICLYRNTMAEFNAFQEVNLVL